MDILLDTHAAIWFFEDDKRLSKSAIDVICNLENMIYISIASLWEIGIKISTGKLNLNGGIEKFIETVYKNEFVLLQVAPEHIKRATELPFIHRDPFDRMLAAQAAVEKMTIVTLDENIVKYEVDHLW